jgi:hypothetical protein
MGLSMTVYTVLSRTENKSADGELHLKGTVPRDFSPQLFFMKHISLGP